MVIILMGPSSSGKSTLAKELNRHLAGKIYSGKDYLRLAKNRDNAWKAFVDQLSAVEQDRENHIIYVCTELDEIKKLRALSVAKFIKVTADLQDMEARFATRMGGNLPAPLAQMLKRQLSSWQNVESALTVDSSEGKSVQQLAEIVLSAIPTLCR